MPEGMPTPFDADRVAAVTRALGSPARLRLLWLLRHPHVLGDVHLAPQRSEGGAKPTRPMSLASVRQHVVQLAALGVVRAKREVRGGRAVDLYEVNRPQVFALTEELRALADLPGSTLLDGTMPGPPAVPADPPQGPHLVLVRGLGEGRAFPLDPGRREWTVGRGEGSEVCLDYDGFVSLQNTRLLLDGHQLVAEDVATSRNGTSVNWRPLPRGGRTPVHAGDVIGVGRSLLLLRVP